MTVKFEQDKFTFNKPTNKLYSDGYDRIFGKKTCQKKCKREGDICSGCGRTMKEIEENGKP